MEDYEGINKSSMRIEMPKEGRHTMYFKNHHQEMPVPCVIYADFESIQVPKSGQRKDRRKN